MITPFVGFAESNNSGNNGNSNKVEQSNNVKQNKGNFMFNMFSNWFNKRADAQTTNTNGTPSITGITAPTVLKLGEVGTWEVKASDSNNGALTYSVDWGDTNIIARSFAMLSQPVFVQTGTFTHSYATKGEYKITFTVSNATGAKTTSKVTVRIVESPDTIAPVISNLAVSSIKVNKATLTWLTDTKSNSLVWISKTSPVDTSLNTNALRKAQVLNHKIMLNKLDANTKYYVVVGGTNDIGTTKSSEISFTTPAVVTPPVVIDTTAPVISNIETRVNGSNVTIAWTTNELSTSNVYTSTITPLDIVTSTTTLIADNSLALNHSLNIPSLTSNTLYHFIVKSVDASNNTVSSNELSFRTN
jgi:hypothetical protein